MFTGHWIFFLFLFGDMPTHKISLIFQFGYVYFPYRAIPVVFKIMNIYLLLVLSILISSLSWAGVFILLLGSLVKFPLLFQNLKATKFITLHPSQVLFLGSYFRNCSPHIGKKALLYFFFFF